MKFHHLINHPPATAHIISGKLRATFEPFGKKFSPLNSSHPFVCLQKSNKTHKIAIELIGWQWKVDWKDVCLQCCGKLCEKSTPTEKRETCWISNVSLSFTTNIFHAADCRLLLYWCCCTCCFVGVVDYRRIVL